MQTTNKSHIAYLADACAANGVSKFVISPGSRNAPIVLAAEAQPSIETFTIHDERVAAFFALGMAQGDHSPVAITCTSGSAALNYAPAIVEAYYRQVPLLILTADRPTELIDQGDGQTMRQQDVYQNYIKQSFALPNHDDSDQLANTKTILDLAFKALNTAPFGPVHVNIPLAEPLYDTVERVQFEMEEVKLDDEKQMTNLPEEIKEAWLSTEKKLIIVGQQNHDPRFQNKLKQLSADPSIAVLVENTSNLQDFSSFCHCIDRTLAGIGEGEKKDFAPELIISMGGAVISKRIKAYFRQHKAKHNWRVGKYLIKEDTYQSLTAFLDEDPVHFMDQLIALKAPIQSNFGSKWKQKDFLAQENHKAFIAEAPYSDLTVFDVLLDSIPDDAILHMGNSSVVRYCQLFDPIRGTQYQSNRGVSGIDGSSSTAAGQAVLDATKLNVLIVGDISFFYDSNAFWNQYLEGNLKVIVINNGGGGIFQIIPGPAESHLSTNFFAPNKANVKGVCETYDLNYFQANSQEEVAKSVEKLFSVEKNNRPTVLEISTQNASNAEVLKSYFSAISVI